MLFGSLPIVSGSTSVSPLLPVAWEAGRKHAYPAVARSFPLAFLGKLFGR